MLAVVVAATISSGLPAASVQIGCAYGSCPAGASTFPGWATAIIVLFILLVIVAIVVLIARSRRGALRRGGRPSGPAGSMSGHAEAPLPLEPWVPAGPASGPAIAGAVVSSPPPLPPPSVPEPVGPAEAPMAPTSDETAPETNIDALMAELDSIIAKSKGRGGSGRKGREPPSSENSDSKS
jgi:hypothetical protein